MTIPSPPGRLKCGWGPSSCPVCLVTPRRKVPGGRRPSAGRLISSTGQGKKWGISRLVHGADFSPGGSSPFSCSPGEAEDRNSRVRPNSWQVDVVVTVS